MFHHVLIYEVRKHVGVLDCVGGNFPLRALNFQAACRLRANDTNGSYDSFVIRAKAGIYCDQSKKFKEVIYEASEYE